MDQTSGVLEAGAPVACASGTGVMLFALDPNGAPAQQVHALLDRKGLKP